MAKFEALELSLQLVRALRELAPRIAHHDRELAEQVRSAANSASSNLSEGAQRMGKDRLQHYRISGGSAAEVRTQIELAVAWGYLEPQQAREAHALADRCVAITWRLTHPRR